jgi:hypothetical protein
MQESREGIKFFVKEQKGLKEIHRRLKVIYDDRTMK